MPTVAHGDFEWDEDKATSNLAKHGVSFDEAALILYIVSTESDDRVRIISARDATRQEQRRYEEAG